MNHSIDPGILGYISNHLMMAISRPDRIPTLPEVNTYNTCLAALDSYAKLQIKFYDSVVNEVEKND